MTRKTEFRSAAAPLRRALGAVALCAAVALPVSVTAQPAPTKPAAAQPSEIKDADPVLARVAGTEIRQSDVNLAEEDLGQQGAQMSPEQKQEYLISYLSDIIIVAKAAEEKRVAESAEFKRRLNFSRNKILMETMLQAEGKAAVTDKAMKEVYDEAVKQMGNEEEVRARHILVQTEDEAKAVVAELKKGGDFAAIAKSRSKDPGAAAQGGDLGYFTKDQMVPEFAEVAFKLEKGQTSDPVKSQFGWHVIRVEDKRAKPAPAFDAVKEQVETYVVRKAQAEMVTKLREANKVERLDKPAAPAAKPGEKPAEKPAEKK
jgi:peptidyl-prolyl cis-trans isomerase C